MLTNREKLTAQAQKYVERGQYDRAIREYQKLVAEDDKDVRTWLKIGDLYVKIGQKSEAAHTYQRVAKFYSDQGFYLKAVAVCKQILKLDPRLVEINLALAELYRQLAMSQEAIAQYEVAASALQRDGRSGDAVSAHKAILEIDPDNVAQRIKLAELYSKEGLVAEATREFSHLAEQLRQQSRVEDFLKVGERLLFHDPTNRAMAKELAALYLQRGDARRALTRLQATFKADPQDFETLELLSQVFLALNQNQKCISVLKELARVYIESQRPEQAALAYQRVLEIDAADPEARAAQASLPRTPYGAAPEPSATTGGATTGEVIEYVAAGEQPDEEVARIVTEADVYAKYGLYHKAVEHLLRALERQPSDRGVRKRLYELYERGGQLDEAVRELWSMMDLASSQEEAAFYLGEVLRIDPRNDAAIQRWKQIRAAGPGWQGAGIEQRSTGRQTGELVIEVEESLQEALPPPDPPGVHGGTAGLGESESADSSDPGAGSMKDELDEVDFFLRQGMQREARLLLESLHRRYPEDGVVVQRLHELELTMGREQSGVMRERDVAVAEEQGELVGPAYQMTRQGWKERGVSRAEAGASFDLGLAYRDMGLYADAIAEFRKAMTDQRREVECRKLIGMCFLEQDQYAEAIAELKRALYAKGISDVDLVEIYYHLGRAYEQLEDRAESIYFYEKALKYGANFRDARERVAQLRR